MPIIREFFSDGSLSDSTIIDLVMKALSEGSSADPETLILTIASLYILKEAFGQRREEWALIADKAKDFLKGAGVNNVEKHLKKVQLVIREAN